jgi:hypothetical protein
VCSGLVIRLKFTFNMRDFLPSSLLVLETLGEGVQTF